MVKGEREKHRMEEKGVIIDSGRLVKNESNFDFIILLHAYTIYPPYAILYMEDTCPHRQDTAVERHIDKEQAG